MAPVRPAQGRVRFALPAVYATLGKSPGAPARRFSTMTWRARALFLDHDRFALAYRSRSDFCLIA